MEKADFLLILEELVNEHTSRGMSKIVPVFALDNEDLCTYLDENDHVQDYTDGLECLESIAFAETSIVVGDWIVHFDFVKELWVFTKKLDYVRVVQNSHNSQQIVKEKMTNRLGLLDPRVFEKLLIYLFEKIPGTTIFVQPQSYDGGFEFTALIQDFLSRKPEWLLVQAKQQRNAVSVSQVRELIGSLSVEKNKHRERTYRGLMISQKPASAKAIEAARNSHESVDFFTHDEIVDLLVKYELGWTMEKLEFWTFDDHFWDDLEEVN